MKLKVTVSKWKRHQLLLCTVVNVSLHCQYVCVNELLHGDVHPTSLVTIALVVRARKSHHHVHRKGARLCKVPVHQQLDGSTIQWHSGQGHLQRVLPKEVSSHLRHTCGRQIPPHSLRVEDILVARFASCSTYRTTPNGGCCQDISHEGTSRDVGNGLLHLVVVGLVRDIINRCWCRSNNPRSRSNNPLPLWWHLQSTAAQRNWGSSHL